MAVTRYLPMSLVMGVIFLLSHQPGDSLALPSIPHLDKVAHLTIYAVLAISVFWAMPERVKDDRALMAAVSVVAFCFFYGLTDEYHQSFIPGRFVSGLDLVADTAGAALVASVWLWRWRTSEKAKNSVK